MFDANNGIFVDQVGNILKTTNGGNSFDITAYISQPSDIFMLDANTGFITADSESFFKTIDGGYHWIRISQFPALQISKCYFFSEITGIIYGTNSLGSASKIFQTTNGGLSWTTVLNDASFGITSVSFPFPGTGYAVCKTFLNRLKLFKTINYGQSWDSISNSLSTVKTNCVNFINVNTGYIASEIGTGYLYKTTNGGNSWSMLPFNQGRGNDIKFFDSNTGYMFGTQIVSSIYKTTDGGNNWNEIPINNYTGDGQFRHVQFLDANNFIGTGDNKFIIKTINGGANWISLFHSIMSNQILDIRFRNANTGIAVGGNTILITSNGGTVWNSSTIPSANLGYAMSPASGVYYAFDYQNYYVYRSTNSGASWDTTNCHHGEITGGKFINAQTGFGICKYYYFFKTTNSGNNWSSTGFSPHQFFALDFLNENTGIIGGDEILKTENGGTAWNTVNILPGFNMDCVQFTDSMTIYASGESQNFRGLVKSTNSGLNWLPVYQNEYISIISFINSTTGFITNRYQILKTTDGGISWILIQQNECSQIVISFVDQNTGYAAGDNGIILKTTNGGIPIAVNNISVEIPKDFHLKQNYPNPFNPTTKIKFDIPGQSFAKLIVYDILGREVAELVNEELKPGTYSFDWDGSNYASGIYFYQLVVGDNNGGSFVQTKKMLMIK